MVSTLGVHVRGDRPADIEPVSRLEIVFGLRVCTSTIIPWSWRVRLVWGAGRRGHKEGASIRATCVAAVTLDEVDGEIACVRWK